MAFTPSVTSRLPKYSITPATNTTNDDVHSLFTPLLQSRVHCRSKYYISEGFLDTRESRNAEFKSAQGRYIYDILPQSVAKYGCAFANGNGGSLYLGIRDDGLIAGIYLSTNDESHVIRTIERAFSGFLPRPPSHNVRFVPLCSRNRVRLYDHYKVIEITVDGGTRTDIFETRDHKVYIKRDGSIELLNPLGIKDLAIANYKLMLQERS